MTYLSLLYLWIAGVVGGALLFGLYVAGGRALRSRNNCVRSVGEGLYIGSYLVGVSFGTAFGMIAPAATIGWTVTTLFGV